MELGQGLERTSETSSDSDWEEVRERPWNHRPPPMPAKPETPGVGSVDTQTVLLIRAKGPDSDSHPDFNWHFGYPASSEWSGSATQHAKPSTVASTTSIIEPELPGAETFRWSRSRNEDSALAPGNAGEFLT